jgi:cytochrome c oxidase subunit 4
MHSGHSNDPAHDDPTHDAAGRHGPVTRPGDLASHADGQQWAGHGGAGHEGVHHGGLGTYLAVFLALCGLTTLSFFTYSSYWPWRDEPQVGWAFMMAVSCTKAMLVVLFFMHVLWEANWKYVLTIPAAMMAIFLVIMLIPDIGMRSRMLSQERLLYMARPSDQVLLERASANAPLAEPEAH